MNPTQVLVQNPLEVWLSQNATPRGGLIDAVDIAIHIPSHRHSVFASRHAALCRRGARASQTDALSFVDLTLPFWPSGFTLHHSRLLAFLRSTCRDRTGHITSDSHTTSASGHTAVGRRSP